MTIDERTDLDARPDVDDLADVDELIEADEVADQRLAVDNLDEHDDHADHDGVAELPADRFSDRELSWLAFNSRVLDLAKDARRVPLLERARFLAIFSSNLDEFYMVRVAGLKRRIAAGVAVPSASGMLPRDLHDAILNRTRELVAEESEVFATDIRPALAEHGIEILRWDELTPDERSR